MVCGWSIRLKTSISLTTVIQAGFSKYEVHMAVQYDYRPNTLNTEHLSKKMLNEMSHSICFSKRLGTIVTFI